MLIGNLDYNLPIKIIYLLLFGYKTIIYLTLSIKLIFILLGKNQRTTQTSNPNSPQNVTVFKRNRLFYH